MVLVRKALFAAIAALADVDYPTMAIAEVSVVDRWAIVKEVGNHRAVMRFEGSACFVEVVGFGLGHRKGSGLDLTRANARQADRHMRPGGHEVHPHNPRFMRWRPRWDFPYTPGTENP